MEQAEAPAEEKSLAQCNGNYIMAKNHRRRRRRRGITTIPVSGSIVVGALATGIVISGNLIAQVAEDFFAISADLSWNIRGHTAGEGPLRVGVAHGDYVVSEIKEYLDVDMSDPGDKIAIERGRRQIRRAGVFTGLDADEALFDGMQRRVPLKFIINDTKALNLYLHNQSGATLTTGTTLQVDGQVYGRWLY